MKYKTEIKISNGTYEVELPLVSVSSYNKVALFNSLGCNDFISVCGRALYDKVLELGLDFDYVVTPETKGIPIAQELSRLLAHKHYIVLRKSVKTYTQNPIIEVVKSLTTDELQNLVLDKTDSDRVRGKRVVLFDDVVSTGETLSVMKKIMSRSGATVVGSFCVFLESKTSVEGLTSLGNLPIFDSDGKARPLE